MRNPFKRDTDDPLMRLFLDKYRLNLLSIPREDASLGDVYITDKKKRQVRIPPANIKYLLDPSFDFSKIGVTTGETMADISGTVSSSISSKFGLGFLENFLNALSPRARVGAKIRANYEANGVRSFKFRFSSPTRDYVDPYYVKAKLQRHKIAQGHELKGRRYYLVTGIVRSSSITIIADNQDKGKADVDVDVISNIGQGELSIEKAANGEITFTGKNALAFGVELFELIYDKDSNRIKFNTVTRPNFSRKLEESDATVIEPAFIGDSKEGNALLIIPMPSNQIQAGGILGIEYEDIPLGRDTKNIVREKPRSTLKARSRKAAAGSEIGNIGQQAGQQAGQLGQQAGQQVGQLVEQLAQRVGINPDQARSVMAVVSKTLLQKAEPGKTQGLMSKLPDSITGVFSDSEKQEFTTTRKDVSNEEVIQRIDREAGINDENKSQRAVEESVNILQDETGESDLLGSVMGGFNKMFGGGQQQQPQRQQPPRGRQQQQPQRQQQRGRGQGGPGQQRVGGGRFGGGRQQQQPQRQRVVITRSIEEKRDDIMRTSEEARQAAPETAAAIAKASKIAKERARGAAKNTKEAITGRTKAGSKTQLQENEQILERYPYSRFPSKVVLDNIVPLDIIIKTTPPSGDARGLRIRASKKDQSEIPISVIVDPGTFEIQGESYYTTIHVPVESKDSIPVTFFLKAKEKGQQSINIRFLQQGTFLGKLTVNTLVVESQEEVKDVQTQAISADWRLPRTIYPGPDITLYIIERPESEMKYDILLTSSEYPIKRIGPIPFKGNPEEKFRSMIEDIEKDLKLPANVAENRISATGRTLYDEIFPPDLQSLYWEKRETIKSIRVISDEPWIPWEMIKPHRKKTEDGKIQEDPFLCERYSFSRWRDGIKEKLEDKQLRKAVLIAPSNTDLEQGDNEVNWFKKFAKNAGLGVEEISAYEEVIYTLENDEFDLLHLTSHGFYNTGNSLLSALKLENGGEIRPDEISGNIASFGRFKPIVILNACQTGALGFSLTKTMGWSKSFIEAGSSVFIGTAWSVTDQAAFKFVQFLYGELDKGTILGEAVRRARNHCRSKGDPSWLAYQLYGHPNLQIKIGQG